MLRGISEIRAFFRTNQTPVYFVSPTAFDLLGIDRWLRNFFYVNYFDSFEGSHPRVLEIDDLADVDSGELYLGEINPRISSVTSMTNVTAGAYADMPLFLFHLLEYMDVDYEIDVDDINRRWAAASSVDVWSQIILKDTGDEVEQLTRAPRTGIWRLENGGLEFARWGHDWHSLHDDGEAFFLRVLAPGDFTYPGADLGVLVARSRMQTEDNRLTERALEWIDGVHSQFVGTPAAHEPAGALAFKTA
jgi:hypothetical protein